MVVIDLDDINAKPFNMTTFEYAMHHMNRWDAVFFNRKNYYDLWALRYREYNLNIFSLEPPLRGQEKIKTAMKEDITERLNNKSYPYFEPVLSAFGGLGIYKLPYTLSCHYGNGYDSSYPNHAYKTTHDCEHVDFHKCMIGKNAARLMILNQCLSCD
jgi:hypothetical protein